jgi:hypothetical protein
MSDLPPVVYCGTCRSSTPYLYGYRKPVKWVEKDGIWYCCDKCADTSK